MEVDGVEEGVLVVGVDGTYCCHGAINGVATNELAEENCEALCCGGGSDGEAERDEVSGEDGAVVDDWSAEWCTFARGEHEKLAPIGGAEGDESGGGDHLVVPAER